jgi:hypothetical protein
MYIVGGSWLSFTYLCYVDRYDTHGSLQGSEYSGVHVRYTTIDC